MGQTDAAVDEQNRKTRQRQEPIKDISAIWCQVNERKTSEEELNDDDVDGTALLVNIGHELGSHTL